VTLPPEIIADLQLDWIGSEEGMLGDGSLARFDVYAGIILWNGEPRRVEVNASKADALVGMELLRGSRLEIEVVDGGVVSIREMSQPSS
jgi:predicted aspartyl protease